MGIITDHRRINTLELAAVRLALKNFESLIKDRQITVLSDNVTALSCLRKRRSADFERNGIISDIVDLKLQICAIEYIPTGSNQADAYSRHPPFTINT